MKKRILIVIVLLLNFYVVCAKLDSENVTYYDNPIIEKEIVVERDIDYWIKHYSKQYDLDWKLVKAIGILESGLNPKARSKSSTASGLFQFLKQTNKDWHMVLGVKNFNHYNVPIDRQCELACLYLKYLHKKYKGNRHLVLKEYSGNGIGDLYQKKIKYNIAMLNKGYDYDIKNGRFVK